MRPKEEFIQATEIAAFNKDMHQKVHHAVEQYENSRKQGLAQFANLELARDRAAYVRWKVIENLDKYLIEFEATVHKETKCTA